MKKIFIAVIVLFFLCSAAQAQYTPPMVSLTVDFARDSWGFEAGGKFGKNYYGFGYSEINTEDAPNDYDTFSNRPIIWWTYYGRFNYTDEGEMYLKYGRFITDGFGLEGALGYGWQDRVTVYFDPFTGLLWGKEEQNYHEYLTAYGGINVRLSKGHFSNTFLRAGWHTRRGAVVGIGVRF